MKLDKGTDVDLALYIPSIECLERLSRLPVMARTGDESCSVLAARVVCMQVCVKSISTGVRQVKGCSDFMLYMVQETCKLHNTSIKHIKTHL